MVSLEQIAAMASYLTESSRWVALEAHDPLADGNFVYCVKSTGIYCRPTCGARLARRANVVFQDDASAAQEAGFRACKRCKPHLDKDDSQATLVARARHTIEKTQAETGSMPSIADLAEAADLTKSYFHRIFKKITGVTPRVYAQGLAKNGNTDLNSPRSIASETPSLGYMESKTASEGPATPVHQLPSGPQGPASKSSEFSYKSPIRPQPRIVGKIEGSLIDDLFSMASGLPGRMARPEPRLKEIFYTIQPWGSSFVLIATSANGICLMDIDDSSDALLETLSTQFPDANLALSLWSPMISSAGPEGHHNWQDAMFENIMNALVDPTGKIVVPFWELTSSTTGHQHGSKSGIERVVAGDREKARAGPRESKAGERSNDSDSGRKAQTEQLMFCAVRKKKDSV
ncbi:hypothetical protein O988_07465 [Pseudogymnoascus sp. VKM F-3808]|nr:hypothetical protein O988_07465 [Pseudogymnoascus sp. VKM F-3808]